MLLNPSHKITFSGLPPDVLDAYVRYKKGTRALVAWFIQYSPSPNRRVKSLPIKELESLAHAASKKLRSLPDMVHFYFRETIAARKRLSKYFRGQVDESLEDEDTVNHEHFTTSLAQIYDDLCACCGRPDRNTPHRVTNPDQLADGRVNLYVGLPIEDVDDDEGETRHPPLSSACPECTATTPAPCDGVDLAMHFADDGLGTVLEVAAAVQRIQNISSSVEYCWCLAGNGQLSFIVAAFVTNVAFSMLRQVGVELLEREGHVSLSGLHQMFCSLKRPGSVGSGGRQGEDLSHSVLDELQRLEQSLFHHRDGHRPLIIPSCAGCLQKPADYIQSPAADGDTRPKFVEAVIDNIVHLVGSRVAPANIVRNSTPVYADVGYLITGVELPVEAQSWSPVLGLDLLISSYQTYLHSLASPNTVSKCRLGALRLAQQASTQVSRVLSDKTCFPCRCTQTLAYHLQNLESDLQSYARFKCWDMYFQAPWVAGNHILEMLDLCHYYGLRLFNYRHYVGAVLHSYNVLQQLAGLEEVPVLESVCAQFGHLFFPGGHRPKGSFRACWSRYVGARLKFKKGHRNRNSRDSWCMAIPAYAARRAAGLGAKGEPHQGKTNCLLFQIKQQDYHVGDDVWSSLERTRTRSGSTSTTALDSDSDSIVPEQRLLDLARKADELFTDSEGDSADHLPLARLNLLAVFETCVGVVSQLSDETHPGADEKGINCICFASAILTGGDRIVDGRRLGRLETWKKDERECVSQAKKVIQDVFGNVSREAWLWDV